MKYFVCFVVFIAMALNVSTWGQPKPTKKKRQRTTSQTTTPRSSNNAPQQDRSNDNSQGATSSNKKTKRNRKSQTGRNNSNKGHNKNKTKSKKQDNYFYVENEKYFVSFGPDGGTEYFQIMTNTSWDIKTQTYNWGHLYRNGNSITLRVEPNNATTSREDYFIIGKGNNTKTIKIAQRGRPETRLSVSSTSLSFNENGGTKTMNIDANTNWSIKETPASWVHTYKNGNQLQISLDPNTSRESRNGFFTIVAGDKTVRVDITQAKKKPQLTVSEKNVHFSNSSGTKYITIDSDGEDWYIDGSSVSWAHLSKSGNYLEIKIDSNTSTSERSNYFTIKSGANTKDIFITQDAAPYTNTSTSYYNNTYSSRNQYKGESWWKGRVSFGIEGQGSVYYAYKPWREVNEELFYSFGAGVVLRFGKYSDFLNLTLGCRWMRLGYNNEDLKVNYGNHVVVPGNLKLNLFYMGEISKFYMGGGFEYGFGLKDMPNFMDWNAGIGINSRHIDWYIFYKQFMKCKNVMLFDDDYKRHIGTSITIYF